jgi:hypothetical protein
VATEDGKNPQRGYKLGLLSTLIDTGRLLVQLAWEGIRPADVTVCRPFVTEGTPLLGNFLRNRASVDTED